MYHQIRLPRSSKYNNKSSFYNGYWYQSKLEADYAAILDLRLKAKELKSWSKQVVIPVIFYGETYTKYKMDFEIIENDDTVTLVETKGFEDPAWKYRWKALEIAMKCNPPDRYKGKEVRLQVVKRGDF